MAPNPEPEIAGEENAVETESVAAPSQTTPVGLEQRLLARARAAGLRRGDRVIVGFSGGRDSLALAGGLRRAREVLGIEPLLVHVDHRLRAESGAEAEAAEALARRLGLAFEARVVKEPPTEAHARVGVEEAARRARYGLLFEAAREAGARAVATGHHEGDQAETVLLHLLRGGGVHGAAGMREWGGAPYPAAALHDSSVEIGGEAPFQLGRQRGDEPALWRPLLREPRSAIDAYVTFLGWPWVEDPSNADRSLRRNVIRHEVMPLLEAKFSGATAALARYADLAAADDDVLMRIAGEALERAVTTGGRLRAASLGEQLPGMRRRIVRGWLTRETGSDEFAAERIDAAIELALAGRGGRKVEVGGGWTVRLERGMLSAERPGDQGGGTR